MTITNLNYNNFELRHNILKLKIPGNSTGNSGLIFVMFKQESCSYCRVFVPQFEAMSRMEQRVKFCYADISEGKIASMSQTTNTPINSIPMFILYLNGLPLAKYIGIREQGKMLEFLNKMIETVK